VLVQYFLIVEFGSGRIMALSLVERLGLEFWSMVSSLRRRATCVFVLQEIQSTSAFVEVEELPSCSLL